MKKVLLNRIWDVDYEEFWVCDDSFWGYYKDYLNNQIFIVEGTYSMLAHQPITTQRINSLKNFHTDVAIIVEKNNPIDHILVYDSYTVRSENIDNDIDLLIEEKYDEGFTCLASR